MSMTFVVPDPVENEIRRLRREAANYRHQLKAARAEAAQLQAQLDAVTAVGK